MLTGAGDDPVRTIGCHHTIGLRSREGRWLLSPSRVRVVYQEGDPGLEALARERVAGNAP